MSEPKRPTTDDLVTPTEPGAIELSETSLDAAVGGASATGVSTASAQKLNTSMKWTPGNQFKLNSSIGGADGSV